MDSTEIDNNANMLGNKRSKDHEGPDYDSIRSENQNKAIIELKKEIEEFKRRERAFITHLHLKEKEIYYLESNLREANSKLRERPSKECFIDHCMLNEFNRLKAIIKEKDEKIMQKEEMATLYMPPGK